MIGKSLQAGDHRDRQPRHTDEVHRGRSVGDSHAVNAERPPSALGARRSKVGSAVLERTAHNGWSDVVSALFPRPGSPPAGRGHQVKEGFSDGFWASFHGRWPRKVGGNVLFQGHDDYAWAQLGHTEVRGVEQAPFGVVPHSSKAVPELLPEIVEDGGEKAADVLKHDRARTEEVNQVQRDGKEIPFVQIAKLFACDGKGRTGKAPGNQLDALEAYGAVVNELVQVLFKDAPLRAILPQSVARVTVDLDQGLMMESGLLKAERLTSSARAEF